MAQHVITLTFTLFNSLENHQARNFGINRTSQALEYNIKKKLKGKLIRVVQHMVSDESDVGANRT